MSDLIPVIDLFSGPGGLAEGFAAPSRKDGRNRFHIALSIENDVSAHRTLRLRSFLRKFGSCFPPEYYEFLNNSSEEEPDWSRLDPIKWREACDETPLVKLGTEVATSLLAKKIHNVRKEHGWRTVLLGGPPCQSYSVVGRARNAGNPHYDIDLDDRLTLYEEYVYALKLLQPAVAVLENVKGIVSARYHNERVFNKVMDALQNAGGTDRYGLYSLNTSTESDFWTNGLNSGDFVVRAEEYGVPQRRHRVFVICIRNDIVRKLPHQLLPKLRHHESQVTVDDVIGWMPTLRSRLSRGDSGQAWQQVVQAAYRQAKGVLPSMSQQKRRDLQRALRLVLPSSTSSPLPFRNGKIDCASHGAISCPDELRGWLHDRNMTSLPNNETRGHISQDIERYLYASAFALAFGRSPRAPDFPVELAPSHANWNSGKFADRFRVQLANEPATTITSHISKDGHYFIHPDPRQCRSLTVREAARLQTFPDNYLFCGGRTQQYVQVGNAVPPYLAWQIADQIIGLLEYIDRRESRVLRPSRSTAGRPSGFGGRELEKQPEL